MFGLIKKDLLMAKSNLKIILLIIIAYLIMGIGEEESYTFAFIPSFISVVIMMSTFSYDEYNKTDAFLAALPNGKKNAVKAKYLSTLIIALSAIILTLIGTFIINLTSTSLNYMTVLESIIGAFFGICILMSIIYPLIYKFGIEKSRIAIFVGTFSLVGLFALLNKSGFNITFPVILKNTIDKYGNVLIPIISLLVIFISYKISEYIYLKKEF